MQNKKAFEKKSITLTSLAVVEEMQIRVGMHLSAIDHQEEK